MINTESIRKICGQLNWKNLAFRLWIVFTLAWEPFAFFILFTEGFYVETLFALLFPFFLLIAVVLLAKLCGWVFGGLHDKGGKIDAAVYKISKFLTLENTIHFANKIYTFIKLRMRKKVSLIIIISCVIIGTVAYLQKTLPATTTFQISKNGKMSQENASLYKVRAPDGWVIVIEGPTGATTEEVITQAQRLYQPTSNSAAQHSAVKEPKEPKEPREPQEPVE